MVKVKYISHAMILIYRTRNAYQAITTKINVSNGWQNENAFIWSIWLSRFGLGILHACDSLQLFAVDFVVFMGFFLVVFANES